MQDTLLRVAELVKETIPAVAGASITVLADVPCTTAFSGRLALDLDEQQYAAGFGPCLDAARAVHAIAVNQTDPLTPYAEFIARAAAVGVSHTLAIGLPLEQRIAAALNIYATDQLSQASLGRAAAFAGYAAAALDYAAVRAREDPDRVQLRAAERRRP